MVTLITDLFIFEKPAPSFFFSESVPHSPFPRSKGILSLWEWKTRETYGGADGGRWLPPEHPSNSILCFSKIQVTGLSQLQCVDISNTGTRNVKSRPYQSISKHVLHRCNWYSFTHSAAISWALTEGFLPGPNSNSWACWVMVTLIFLLIRIGLSIRKCTSRLR